MDNKKLKKQDSKRISLKQNYELTYIKKIAKELIDILDNSEITVKQIPRPRDLINSEYTINKASKGRIKRLCKFSILAVDKLRRIK